MGKKKRNTRVLDNVCKEVVTRACLAPDPCLIIKIPVMDPMHHHPTKVRWNEKQWTEGSLIVEAKCF